MKSALLSRRLLLKRLIALGMLATLERFVPACAVMKTPVSLGSQTPLSGDVIDLTISEHLFRLDDRTGTAITINGTIPGPIIRLEKANRRYSVSRTAWRKYVDSLARNTSPAFGGWGTRRQLRRYRAGHHVYLSLSGQAKRDLLVS